MAIQRDVAVERFGTMESGGPQLAQRSPQASFQRGIARNDVRPEQPHELPEEGIRYVVADEFAPAREKALRIAQDFLCVDVMPGVGARAPVLRRFAKPQNRLIGGIGPSELR